MTNLCQVGEKVPLEKQGSKTRRIQRDTDLRERGQSAPPKLQMNRKIKQRHSQWGSSLAKSDEWKQVLLSLRQWEENTRPWRGVLLGSYCRTTWLYQRQNKDTRKKVLEWEQTKMLILVKELVPNGQKKARLVCRRALEEGGKEMVGKKEPLNL